VTGHGRYYTALVVSRVQASRPALFTRESGIKALQRGYCIKGTA